MIDHRVQLFDSLESRVEAISAYLQDGFAMGDTMLVVATRPHWAAIQQRLLAVGLPVTAAVAEGRLHFKDANTVLASLTRRGRPDPAAFDEIIGGTLSALIGVEAAPLRIYGEMVDLLANENNFSGARKLEDLWNGLAEKLPFMLLCGYTATHFGDPRRAADLRAICDQHTSIHTSGHDELGEFLIARHVNVAPPA